jgi:hypothetical protein
LQKSSTELQIYRSYGIFTTAILSPVPVNRRFASTSGWFLRTQSGSATSLKQDRARLLEAIETLEALASNTDNLKEEAVKIMEPIRYESAHDKKLLELINDDDRMKHITPLTQRAFLLQPNCHRLLDRASQDFGESSATAKKLLKGFYKG